MGASGWLCATSASICGYGVFHCPLNRQLGGVYNWCGCFEKEMNLLLLPGIRPHYLECLALSLFTMPAELLQMYMCCVFQHYMTTDVHTYL